MVAKRRLISVTVLTLLTVPAVLCAATPVDEASTYQGRLKYENVPANDDFDFIFRLYDAEVGGSQVGVELDRPAVNVEQGLFTVVLDFEDVFQGDDRWLQVYVRHTQTGGSYATLSPRQKLTATPYASYALDAGTAADLELPFAGSASTSAFAFSVVNDGSGVAVRGEHGSTGNVGYLGGSAYGLFARSYDPTGMAVNGLAAATTGANCGVYGVSESNSGTGVYGIADASGGTTYGVRGRTDSPVGYGVYGKNEDNHNYGYLGANACGAYGEHNSTGTYGVLGVSAAGVTAGVYGVNPSNLGHGVFGRAASSSGATCGVCGESDSDSGIGVYGATHASSGTNYGVSGETDSSSGYGVHGKNNASNTTGYLASQNYGVWGKNNNSGNYGYLGNTHYGAYARHNNSGNDGYIGTMDHGVRGDADSEGGVGVGGHAWHSTGVSYGVYGRNFSSAGSGVFGENNSNGNYGYLGGSLGAYGSYGSGDNYGYLGGSTIAVRGVAHVTGGLGVQGYATSETGANWGVYGLTESTTGYGVWGLATASSGTNYGVWGETDSASGYAVYGMNDGNDTHGFLGHSVGAYGRHVSTGNYGYLGGSSYGLYARQGAGGSFAGYFNGNARVTGTLTKGGGSFLIDHPHDPENKYLYHSFVESPDMMNVYNGNIVTDDEGFAEVVLPEWFETLNRDFRYQLTVIGEFAQAIIGEKVRDNRFTILTDKPSVEVSWQITGIRQDPWANANRIPVEQDKPEAEVGSYLHPDLYGQPESSRVDVWLDPSLLEEPEPQHAQRIAEDEDLVRPVPRQDRADEQLEDQG